MLLINDILKQRKDFVKVGLYLLIIIIAYFAMSLIINKVFLTGLEKYYCLTPADVLIVGHSMSEMGLDRTQIEEESEKTIAKYCINGATIVDRFAMIKHYCESTKSFPKIVIYDISARSFSGGLSVNSYVLFYPFIDSSELINEYVKKNAKRKDYLIKKMVYLNRYDTTRLGAAVRGYSANWKNMSIKQFDCQSFKKIIETDNFWKISFESDSIKMLEKTIKYLANNKVEIWLCKFPCVDMLNNAEPEKSLEAMAIFSDLAKRYPNIKIKDYNSNMESDYSFFVDPIHMSRKGQIVLSSKVAKDLKEYKVKGQE